MTYVIDVRVLSMPNMSEPISGYVVLGTVAVLVVVSLCVFFFVKYKAKN